MYSLFFKYICCFNLFFNVSPNKERGRMKDKNEFKHSDRIYAILPVTNKNKVLVLGGGIYIGKEMPPQDILGPLRFKIEFPKLKLDSGEEVYGNECWWGDEKEVIDFLKNKKIETASITSVRKDRLDLRLKKAFDRLLDLPDEILKDLIENYPLVIIEFKQNFMEKLDKVEEGFKFECTSCGKDHILGKLNSYLESEAVTFSIGMNSILFYSCENYLKIGAVDGKFLAKKSNLDLPYFSEEKIYSSYIIKDYLLKKGNSQNEK